MPTDDEPGPLHHLVQLPYPRATLAWQRQANIEFVHATEEVNRDFERDRDDARWHARMGELQHRKWHPRAETPPAVRAFLQHMHH